MLCEDFDLVHISVGDIFRWNIKSHTKLGARIQRVVAAGGLVDDETVASMVQDRLANHDWNFGFILDGFPRNEPQAMFFLESFDIDAVIHIRVDQEVVVQRMFGRRLCENCGLDYNIIDHWPVNEGCCDVCGGRLIQRADDTKEAIENRLNTYYLKTEPILDMFRHKELIITVEGVGEPVTIQNEIRKQLKLPLRDQTHKAARTPAAVRDVSS